MYLEQKYVERSYRRTYVLRTHVLAHKNKAYTHARARMRGRTHFHPLEPLKKFPNFLKNFDLIKNPLAP